MFDMETRSGLKPENTGELPFKVTTEQVEDFVQSKFDAIVEQSRSVGEQIDDVKVTITTVTAGKAFAPFVILLPTTVLKSHNPKKQKNGKKELAVFNPDNSSGKIYIHDGIFSQLQLYGYTTDDRRIFFDRNWKNALGVTQRDSEFLRYNSTPRVQRLNHGKDEFVTCLLDPLKVFSAMLEDCKNPGRNFDVCIEGFVKIAGGVYRYSVLRVPKNIKGKKKGQKNNKDRIAYELQNRIRR